MSISFNGVATPVTSFNQLTNIESLVGPDDKKCTDPKICNNKGYLFILEVKNTGAGIIDLKFLAQGVQTSQDFVVIENNAAAALIDSTIAASNRFFAIVGREAAINKILQGELNGGLNVCNIDQYDSTKTTVSGRVVQVNLDTLKIGLENPATASARILKMHKTHTQQQKASP